VGKRRKTSQSHCQALYGASDVDARSSSGHGHLSWAWSPWEGAHYSTHVPPSLSTAAPLPIPASFPPPLRLLHWSLPWSSETLGQCVVGFFAFLTQQHLRLPHCALGSCLILTDPRPSLDAKTELSPLHLLPSRAPRLIKWAREAP
jgi:hypothetical protein